MFNPLGKCSVLSTHSGGKLHSSDPASLFRICLCATHIETSGSNDRHGPVQCASNWAGKTTSGAGKALRISHMARRDQRASNGLYCAGQICVTPNVATFDRLRPSLGWTNITPSMSTGWRKIDASCWLLLVTSSIPITPATGSSFDFCAVATICAIGCGLSQF